MFFGVCLFTFPPINSIVDRFEIFGRDIILLKVFTKVGFLSGDKIHETRILKVGGILSSRITVRLSISTLFFYDRKIVEIGIPNMLENRNCRRFINTTNTDIHTLEIEGLVIKVREGSVRRKTMKKEMIEKDGSLMGSHGGGLDPILNLMTETRVQDLSSDRALYNDSIFRVAGTEADGNVGTFRIG